jgi:hypothetical protein
MHSQTPLYIQLPNPKSLGAPRTTVGTLSLG